MGLILDSSILIAGERGGDSVRAILKRVQATQGETESGLSAVTVVELTHGIYRAKSDTHRERRRAFTEELCRDLTVHPVTLEIAQLCWEGRGRAGSPRNKHSLRRPADWHYGTASWLCCRNSECPPLPIDSRSFRDPALND